MKIRNLLFLFLLLAIHVRSAVAESPRKVAAMASIMTSQREIVRESTLTKFASGGTVKKTENGKGLTSYEIRWKEALVVFNIDDNYEQTSQNEGMLGWMADFPKEEKTSRAGLAFRKYIPTIARSYGVVLPEGFDTGGVTSAFLLGVARELEGYVFTDNCFYDALGFRVIGLPQSSPFFGRAGRNLVSLEGNIPLNELLAGKWAVTLTGNIVMESLIVGMEIKSVDEFRADGSHVSRGTAAFTVSSGEADPIARMGFDLTSKAAWKTKDGSIILEDEKTETAKPWCNPAEFKEMLDGIVEGLSDDSEDEPEEHWVICRDKNLILLQEKETGLTLSMKRQAN